LKKGDIRRVLVAVTFWVVGMLVPWMPTMKVAEGAADARGGPSAPAVVAEVPATVTTDQDNTAGNGDWKTFCYILLRNLGAFVLMVAGGLVSGGLLSAAGLVWNGFLLGVLVREALARGIEASVLCRALAFHGPVEFTALVWGGAVGLRGALAVCDLLRDGTVGPRVWPTRRELIVLPSLLIVAAVFETIVFDQLAGEG
jgi:uncharacterized membrane protein SpoIIM required for sporulation